MPHPSTFSQRLYRLLSRINPRVARNYQKGLAPTGTILLLTTLGRKSGLPRVTPLQYQVIQGAYFVGSARGAESDWVKNIQACPQVSVQVKRDCFQGQAEVISDPGAVADFLEERLKRSPIFIRLVMHLEGLPLRYRRADLEQFAARKVVVRIHSQGESE